MAYPIDNASLDLILRLQLEDAEGLLRGKHAIGEEPDVEFAAQLFKNDLEQLQTFISDNIMSRSIAQATLMDGDAIQASIDEEQQATYDREYATNFDSTNNPPRTHSSLPLIDDEMMGKLAVLFVGAGDLPTYAAHAESSSQGAKAGELHADYNTRHCTGCEEDVSYIDAIRCPCSHDYCRTCIAGLFEAAISDESLFPARCCRQAIPLGLNQIFIPAKLAGRYRAKELEYGTPNRTYCHNSPCSTFVPPQFIRGNRGTCVKCYSSTCTSCKGPAHERDCPPDAATLDVLRMANDRGWQRCSSCRILVELSTGCNHISKLDNHDPQNLVLTLRQRVAVALNFVTFVERGGRLVLVNSGMKTGYWIVPLLLLIEMRGTDWTMRSELSEWNKNSRTCEIIMNADTRLGGTVRALFSAKNVRISFLSTFTNASTVESWLAEHADATDFEYTDEINIRPFNHWPA